ncbi:MAG TPA: heme-binding beta-barrel domain-containing protein [Burkholderiaceae bacterium]
MSRSDYPEDIYTEPRADPDTLANLGPLRHMAGIWISDRGVDFKPTAAGGKTQVYVERYELQPIDPQTNGPQLLYGLRYHTFIHKPGRNKLYHDQVGYWLWEPATGTVMQTLAIPRGQVAMAMGHATPDATEFELVATHGSETFGICSNPFIESAFKTLEWRIKVRIDVAAGTWAYEQDTVLQIEGQTAPFHHTDSNTLQRLAPASPNPLMSG